jgi:hypothetical protein
MKGAHFPMGLLLTDAFHLLETGPTMHLVRRAVFDMRDVTKPKRSENEIVANIRAVLHEGVKRRFASILADTDRTVLMAAFLHPDTCKDLLSWEEAPADSSVDSADEEGSSKQSAMVLSAATKRLIYGDDVGFDGIVDA